MVGDVVAIATDDGAPLNLRSAPGTGSSISGQLADGSIAGVVAGPSLATGTNWYRVNAAAGNGWVSAEFLQLAPAGAINSARFAVGDTIQVSAGSAALRSQPRAASDLLSTIASGTQMWVEVGPRFRDGIVWYQVTGLGSDSRYGWTDQTLYQKVSSGPPDNTPPQPGDSVVTTSAVNFRIGPTTSAAIITLLPMGTAGTVLGGPTSANGYNWYQLQTSFGIGWCAGSFLRKTASGGTTSPTPTRTATPTRTPTPTQVPGAAFAIGDTVRATTAVNLRSSPSTSGGLLQTLASGTTGTVLAGPVSANGYAWYQLRISGATGWAAGQFFVKTAGTPANRYANLHGSIGNHPGWRHRAHHERREHPLCRQHLRRNPDHASGRDHWNRASGAHSRRRIQLVPHPNSDTDGLGSKHAAGQDRAALVDPDRRHGPHLDLVATAFEPIHLGSAHCDACQLAPPARCWADRLRPPATSGTSCRPRSAPAGRQANICANNSSKRHAGSEIYRTYAAIQWTSASGLAILSPSRCDNSTHLQGAGWESPSGGSR